MGKGLIASQRTLTGPVNQNGLWVGSNSSTLGNVADAGKVAWTKDEFYNQLKSFDDFADEYAADMTRAGYVRLKSGNWVPAGLETQESSGVWSGLQAALQGAPDLAKKAAEKAFYQHYNIAKPFDQYEQVASINDRKAKYQAAVSGLSQLEDPSNYSALMNGGQRNMAGGAKAADVDSWAALVNKYQPTASGRVSQLLGNYNTWKAENMPKPVAAPVAPVAAPVSAPVAAPAAAPTFVTPWMATAKLGKSARTGLINS